MKSKQLPVELEVLNAQLQEHDVVDRLRLPYDEVFLVGGGGIVQREIQKTLESDGYKVAFVGTPRGFVEEFKFVDLSSIVIWVVEATWECEEYGRQRICYGQEVSLIVVSTPQVSGLDALKSIGRRQGWTALANPTTLKAVIEEAVDNRRCKEKVLSCVG